MPVKLVRSRTQVPSTWRQRADTAHRQIATETPQRALIVNCSGPALSGRESRAGRNSFSQENILIKAASDTQQSQQGLSLRETRPARRRAQLGV